MVRFRVGSGLGLGEGRGGARGEGEGSDHRSIFNCSNMSSVLYVECAKQACCVKAYDRPFVGFDCSGYGFHDGRRWVGGGGGVGVVGSGGFAQHRRVQHGGVMVGTWCMCCVYKANLFRKQIYRRFDQGQFTKVDCKTNIPKRCIIVG